MFRDNLANDNWKCVDANTGLPVKHLGTLVLADDETHIVGFCIFGGESPEVSLLMHALCGGCHVGEMRVPKVVFVDATRTVLVNVKDAGDLGDATDNISKLDPIKKLFPQPA